MKYVFIGKKKALFGALIYVDNVMTISQYRKLKNRPKAVSGST